jgi:4-amino-4-deoxy-L-arabinose transferase-like glycosyltransferase
VLLAMMTLALYGYARHLLLGPAWRWYWLAGFMTGLATVTKGVGALALLALLSYAIARRRGLRQLPPLDAPVGRWLGVVPAFLAGVAVWLGPLLLAVWRDPSREHLAYLHEILLGQTAGRYFDAEHHHEPPWYFLRVIATEWLPTSALLVWAVPVWWRRRRRGDGRLWWLLGYFALILLFFTFSSGKRGVYILPALPVLILALAPLLPALVRRRSVRWAGFALALGLSALALVGGLVAEWGRPEWAERLETYRDLDPWLLPIVIGALGLTLCVWLRPRRGQLAILAVLTVAWLLYGTWGYHLLDEPRSARGLMRAVGERIGAEKELGLLNWKEQNLLQADRPAVTFGFLRPRAAQELDAVAWLKAAPERRVLLVQAVNLEACFHPERAQLVGKANRRAFYLVDAGALREHCAPHPPEAWRQRRVADF